MVERQRRDALAFLCAVFDVSDPISIILSVTADLPLREAEGMK